VNVVLVDEINSIRQSVVCGDGNNVVGAVELLLHLDEEAGQRNVKAVDKFGIIANQTKISAAHVTNELSIIVKYSNSSDTLVL
jgi:hypothetical protein